MPITYTHKEFNAAYSRLRNSANQSNLDFNALVLGGAQLYFEHNHNTAYLERAMLVARNHKGLRVNAVRAFLVAMTGVRIPNKANGAPLKKGDYEEEPEILQAITDWTEWANENAKEPEYNHKAAVLTLTKYLEKRKGDANTNKDEALAANLSRMIAMAVRSA